MKDFSFKFFFQTVNSLYILIVCHEFLQKFSFLKMTEKSSAFLFVSATKQKQKDNHTFVNSLPEMTASLAMTW